MAPDGSGRLFDLEDLFYAVEPTGAHMLRSALREDRDTTVQALAQRYGVEPAQLGRDYDTFFDDLERRGLVLARGTTPVEERQRHIATVPLRLLFAATCRLPLRPQAWVLLALARVSISIFGWNEARRTWLRYPGPTSGMSGVSTEAVSEAVRRSAARHLGGVTCKERSLCCLALCRAAGIPATLVLGISLFPLASHCWCESDGGPLTDFPDRCEGFTPVVTYP